MSMKKVYRNKSKVQGGYGTIYCACCNDYQCCPRFMKGQSHRRVRRTAKQELKQLQGESN